MFCIYLRTNSDLCHLQHKLIGFYNRDEKCLQCGTDWVFKWSSLHFVFKGLTMPGTTHWKHNVTFHEEFSLQPCIYYANQKLKSEIKLLNKVQNYVFYDSVCISCNKVTQMCLFIVTSWQGHSYHIHVYCTRSTDCLEHLEGGWGRLQEMCCLLQVF